jgi:hypothetical protein
MKGLSRRESIGVTLTPNDRVTILFSMWGGIPHGRMANRDTRLRIMLCNTRSPAFFQRSLTVIRCRRRGGLSLGG